MVSEYVTFTNVTATCAICDQKSIGFVVDVDKNLAAARRFDGDCLENSSENKKMCRERGFYKMLVFHYKYNANGNLEVAWRYHNAA